MGNLRIKANECGCKGKDKRQKNQFINSINDDDLMTEIRGLTTIKRTNDITS